MPLPRLHLFELEDQPWFPDLLRRGLTDYLATITARTGPYAPVVAPLTELLAAQPAPRVRDFCSGAGGPWPQLLPELREAVPHLTLELSDAFPNIAALDQFMDSDPVSYRRTPLRPTDAWPTGASLATFFSSFHHFRPTEAREILRQAVATETPVAVFEVTQRSARALALMCLAPIAVLFLTPTIRPFRWWRLLLTYVLPVLPLVILWDGLVSCWRTYRPDELLALAASISGSGMEWQAGEWRAVGQPLPVTYLLGVPRPA
jgi:hypothetical protein